MDVGEDNSPGNEMMDIEEDVPAQNPSTSLAKLFGDSRIKDVNKLEFLDDLAVNRVVDVLVSAHESDSDLSKFAKHGVKIPVGTLALTSLYTVEILEQENRTSHNVSSIGNLWKKSIAVKIAVRSMTLQNFLKELRFILLPYNSGYFWHWYGVVFDLQMGMVFVYDSNNQSRNSQSTEPPFNGNQL